MDQTPLISGLPSERSSGPATSTRRTVLAVGAVAGAAATLDLSLLDTAEAATGALPARKVFEQLVGHTFTVTNGGHTMRWRLDAVEDSDFEPRRVSPSALARWRRQSFTLRWSTKALPHQATFTLSHRTTGRFQLFAVPGRRHAHRTSVTVVVNRWRG